MPNGIEPPWAYAPGKLRASSAPVWANCPASAQLPQVPDEDTAENMEGDAVHAMAHDMAASGARDLFDPGPEITDAMIGAAQDFVTFCNSLGCDRVAHEKTLDRGALPEEVSGTPDFIGYDSAEMYLHVVDLKYGFLPVSPQRNWQLLIYSLGAWAEFGERLPIAGVRLHIYQPRDFSGGPVKTWELSLGEWQDLIIEIPVRAAHALTPGAPAKTGDQCRYCPSRVFCPSFVSAVAGLLEVVTPSPDAVEFSPENLGAEYAVLQRAEKLIVSARKAFEDVITSRIKSGAPVPGWSLGRTPGKRRWTAPAEEIAAVENMFGVVLQERKPISVTVALKHKSARPVVESLMTKGAGSEKLVPFDSGKTKEVFK